MGKFPSHDFRRIVGKFTEDTGDTDACPPTPVTAGCCPPSGKISELFEIYIQMGKICAILTYGAIEQSLEQLPPNQEIGGSNPIETLFISSLNFL